MHTSPNNGSTDQVHVGRRYRCELEGKTPFSGASAETLGLGTSHLDVRQLMKAILNSPNLLLAGAESLRKEDKQFPYVGRIMI